MQRFFVKDISKNIVLDSEESKHIAAFRLKEGDRVELFDGKGMLADAVITEIAKRKTMLTVEKTTSSSERTSGRIILVVSIAKGQRFDWIITKATELGIDEIRPAIFARTIKTGEGKNILDRYNNLAISACKQSKRLFVPKILNPTTLESHLSDLAGVTLLTASLGDDRKSIFDIDMRSEKEVAVFIGPEGGLTDQEEAMLCQYGAKSIKLTDTILRTETAAMCAGAILATRRDEN